MTSRRGHGPPQSDRGRSQRPREERQQVQSQLLLPTYDSDDISQLVKLNGTSPSLTFDRFVQIWYRSNTDGSVSKKSPQPDKHSTFESLKQIAGLSCGAGNCAILKEVNERRRALASAKGGLSFELKTKWRFTTGLGAAHPSEIGFRWDHLLSVPVIPGSSIKGALRAWLRDFKKDGARAEKLLGTPDCIGKIVILDALPKTPPRLDVDIINSHYQEYYQDPDKNPPGDYYSPNPVFFLTTAPNTVFVFHILPVKEIEPGDLDYVKKCMCEAFESIGLGAKTSSGYGRFVFVSTGSQPGTR